jgi:phosphatidylserine/phosphatidylglycerophosphate/cardiolipin synthase-like enzyme
MRVLDCIIARFSRHTADAAGRLGGIECRDRGLLLAEEDCAAFAVRAIDNAESEILVSAYGLTTGFGIVEALARAKRRGVDVRLIADKTTPCGRSSGVPLLADAGVLIWIDDQARIAHEKAMVIDETVTLMGSYNWTRGASANSEGSSSHRGNR